MIYLDCDQCDGEYPFDVEETAARYSGEVPRSGVDVIISPLLLPFPTSPRWVSGVALRATSAADFRSRIIPSMAERSYPRPCGCGSRQ